MGCKDRPKAGHLTGASVTQLQYWALKRFYTGLQILLVGNENMAEVWDAVTIAKEVLAGNLSPRIGCECIAVICHNSNYPPELGLFSLLAHEQSGHEQIGITAESLEPEIIQACKDLVQCHS